MMLLWSTLYNYLFVFTYIFCVNFITSHSFLGIVSGNYLL